MSLFQAMKNWRAQANHGFAESNDFICHKNHLYQENIEATAASPIAARERSCPLRAFRQKELEMVELPASRHQKLSGQSHDAPINRFDMPTVRQLVQFETA